MRLTILAVLLLTAPLALCQTAAPAPSGSKPIWLIPPGSGSTSLDIDQIPQSRRFTLQVPKDAKIFSSTTVPHLTAGAQTDPQMIVHPPPGVSAPKPGIQVEQNLYPGLQLLPIVESETGLLAFPTAWPELKIEQIPIAYPKCRITPVDGSATAADAKK